MALPASLGVGAGTLDWVDVALELVLRVVVASFVPTQ